jgi:hypothetical protein
MTAMEMGVCALPYEVTKTHGSHFFMKEIVVSS